MIRSEGLRPRGPPATEHSHQRSGAVATFTRGGAPRMLSVHASTSRRPDIATRANPLDRSELDGAMTTGVPARPSRATSRTTSSTPLVAPLDGRDDHAIGRGHHHAEPPEGRFRIDWYWRAELPPAVGRERDLDVRRAARDREPRDRHGIADRGDDRSVHRTAVDLPVVGVDRGRRRPCAVGEPRNGDVPNVRVALVAVDDDDAVGRPRGRGLTAFADAADRPRPVAPGAPFLTVAARIAMPWAPVWPAWPDAVGFPSRGRRARPVRGPRPDPRRTTRTRTHPRRCRDAESWAPSTSCRCRSMCAPECRTACRRRAGASAPPACPLTSQRRRGSPPSWQESQALPRS